MNIHQFESAKVVDIICFAKAADIRSDKMKHLQAVTG
jgi:hypothetical protein